VITVKLKLEGLEKLRKAALGNPSLGAAIGNAWAIIYRSFTRLRFHKFSRGGGDWPALAAVTLAARRLGGGGAAILINTGALFAALQPALGTGGLLKTTPLKPLGFKGELTGGSSYKSGATLADVASFHHHGEGRLPKREILAEPDADAIRQMSEHGKRIMVKKMGER
jgi:hypothetical protein